MMTTIQSKVWNMQQSVCLRPYGLCNGMNEYFLFYRITNILFGLVVDDGMDTMINPSKLIVYSSN